MVPTPTSRWSTRTRALAVTTLLSGALTVSLMPVVAEASPASASAPAVSSAAVALTARTGAAPAAVTAAAAPDSAPVPTKVAKKKRVVRVKNSPYGFASYRFNKWYAKRYEAIRYGWHRKQFRCLAVMWGKESGWNERAHNPNGGAHGIPQAQPGSKMASAGPRWRTDPVTQIKWGLQYVKSVYGSPCRAWAFWQNHHWY